MNAVPIIEQTRLVNVLAVSFNSWSPSEILNYFKTRNNVRYFPVADNTQVTREKIDKVLLNCFDFNDETYQLNNHFDWQVNPSSDVEWHIMLHKFYYAVGLGMAFADSGDARYAEKWMALVSTWIESVPISFLSSDVTGRRIQNWIFAHYYFVSANPNVFITPEFYQQFLASLHEQVSYLCDHLTPSRNHRTLELYSIFLAAVVFPELKEASDWLTFAKQELLKNIQNDFLSDGVHCELSTDYHHIVLRNFLGIKKLAVLNNIKLPTGIDDGIKKALEFSMYVHKPDGIIPSLSDGDNGCFLNLLEQGYEFYGCQQLQFVASKGKQGITPLQRSKAFHEGGYYILRSGWGEGSDRFEDERYLIFDCGPLGAGNHGHLDLLSFEMAAYGQSLIVDPGRYTYDESGDTNWRVLFRGTSYHNTVLVNSKNQTRYEFYNHKFKIRGDAPDFELKAFMTSPGLDYVHGIAKSHEYPVTHERKILFLNSEYWVICDVLTATDVHGYDLLFHLSAAAQNQVNVTADSHCVYVDAPNLIVAQPANLSTSLSIEAGYVSNTYGVKESAPILKFSQRAGECCFYSVLYPYKQERPKLSVRSTPVRTADDICNDNIAGCLAINIEKDGQSYKDLVFFSHQEGDKSRQFNRYAVVDPVCFVREDELGRATLKSFSGNQQGVG